jgi:hypothetical protein
MLAELAADPTSATSHAMLAGYSTYGLIGKDIPT